MADSTTPPAAENDAAPAVPTALINAIGAYFLPDAQDKASSDKSAPKPAGPVTVPADSDRGPGQWAFKYDPQTNQLSLEVEVIIKGQNGLPALVLKQYKSIIDPASIVGLLNWLATIKSAMEKAKK